MKEAQEVQTTTQDYNRNPTGKGGFGDNPQNRNPGGTPRTDISIVKLLLKKLAEAEGAEAEAIADTFIAKARGGDFKFAKEVIDRIDGTSPQKTEITGAEGGAIEVEHRHRLTPEQRKKMKKGILKLALEVHGKPETPQGS